MSLNNKSEKDKIRSLLAVGKYKDANIKFYDSDESWIIKRTIKVNCKPQK